jgi:PAS domain S-box-containing protein
MKEVLSFSQLISKAQSVRSKLIVNFLIIALAPLCLLTWFSFLQVNDALKKNNESELKELSFIGKQFSINWFDDHIKDLNLLNAQISLPNLPAQQLITQFTESYNFVDHVEIISIDNNGELSQISPFYAQFAAQLHTELANSIINTPILVCLGTKLDKEKHIILLPVQQYSDTQGAFKTFLVANINLQGLLQNLSEINNINNGTSFFIAHHGQLLITSQHSSASFTFDENTFKSKQIFEHTFTNQQPYLMYIDDLNFLQQPGWQLIVAKPVQVMLNETQQYKQLAILANAAVLILILCSSWWFGRRLSRPLISLANTMEKIAKGGDIHIPILNDSKEFNRLSLDLHQVMQVKAQQQSDIQTQKTALQGALNQLAEQKSVLDEHAIVTVTDLAGKITYVNNKFCEISGYQQSELIGQNHRILNSGVHSAEFFMDMYNTIKNGNVWHGQICNKAKHGGCYWVDTTIAPVTDEIHKIQSYIAIRTDITLHKIQEFDLEQHKTHLQLIIDSTAMGVWDWHIDTGRVTFNNRWAEMIGYSLNELEPTSIDTWYRFVHPEDLVVSESKLKAHFLGESDYYVCETRMKHKLGHWVWILDTAKVVKWNDDGSPKRVIGTHLDINERKEIEADLKNSSDRFASLVGNIPGIIYRCKHDENWTMLYISEQCQTVTGYKPDAFINNKQISFSQLIHTEDSEYCMTQVQHGINTRSAWSFDYRLIASDGSIHWVNEKGQAVYGDNGNVLYLDGFILDITEQYESQIKINRQQRLLESMSKQGQIGAWEIDFELNTLYWSDVVKEIHEVPQNYEPDLTTAIDFYKAGENREKITTLFENAVSNGGSWNTELIIITYFGKECWVKSMGETQFKNGKCVRVFGSFQSIDTRKRLEIEKEKANRYNENLASLTVSPAVQGSNVAKVQMLAVESMCNVLDSERCSLWMFNEQQDVLECQYLFIKGQGFVANSVKLAKADFPAYYSALLKHNILAIDNVNTHPAAVDFIETYTTPLDIRSMLEAVITTGEGNLGVLCAEVVGEYRNWSASEETYLRSLATLVGSTLASQQRKETAEELKVALTQSKQAAVAKSQFLATMSHEIRTPMNGVLGMLELIELEKLPKPIETKVAIAKSSAHSLLGVINDILDFSKVEAGKVELEVINFNARDLIGEVTAAQAFSAQEKGIEIIVDLVGLEPYQLKGDPGRIRQVLTNLISNAVKFTSKGEVVVTAFIVPHKDGLALTINVKDSGIGISKEKQAQLFTPFSQVDASTTREYGGTGLGLAICKQLCELMKGNIKLNSELGAGSEFTASMVLHEGETSARSSSDINIKNLTVLVVDDNETNRIVISHQLNHWGAKVELAEDAEQALTMCQSKVENKQPLYDIAVLDMQMPGMDGIELCRVLKGNDDYKHMPLVMMTSIAGMEGAQRYSEVGFQAYFPKPVTTADLISALAVITDKNQADDIPFITPGYIASLIKPHSREQAHILLVEDNPINQQVSTLMLKKLNYTITLAENGQRALDILNEHPAHFFNVVLMDCQMPVMDGFDATKAIRAGQAGVLNKNLNIIALTANAMEEDKERCLSAGMDDYLSKPIQLETLQSQLEPYFND